jgi:hypothetical protein
VGSRLEVLIEPPEGRGLTFKPSVRKVEANREFVWLGHLVLPGVFDVSITWSFSRETAGRSSCNGRSSVGFSFHSSGAGSKRGSTGFEQMNVA